jgi:hypothetical protein
MILETTYTIKEHKELINDLVGKPYGFFQTIKIKGIGSKRMIIDDASVNMKQYTNDIADTTYANIELRPIGVLIRINKGLRNFTWVIPFYQLVIYKTDGVSIHAQGRYVHFKNSIALKENKNFIKKMLNAKLKYNSKFKLSIVK